MLSNRDLVTVWVGLMLLLVIAMIAVLVIGVVGMELQSRQERLAVRAMLRGDCPAAVAHAARAGRVPWDVRRACLETR